MISAHAFQRDHLAVSDREDRLHVQEIAGERRRPADPTSLRQVLERVDREEEVVVALVMLDEGVDLLVRRPAFETMLHAECEERERRGHGARVDHAHLLAAQHSRGGLRAAERARQFRRERQREDALVPRRELLERGEELARCRL